jgi:hypothetical protein
MMGEGGRHALEYLEAADGGFNQFPGTDGDRGLLPGRQVVLDNHALANRARIADERERLHAGEAFGARSAAMCCGEHATLGNQRIALRLAGHGGAHRCVADKGGRSFAADFVAAGFGRCRGYARE